MSDSMEKFKKLLINWLNNKLELSQIIFVINDDENLQALIYKDHFECFEVEKFDQIVFDNIFSEVISFSQDDKMSLTVIIYLLRFVSLSLLKCKMLLPGIILVKLSFVLSFLNNIQNFKSSLKFVEHINEMKQYEKDNTKNIFKNVQFVVHLFKHYQDEFIPILNEYYNENERELDQEEDDDIEINLCQFLYHGLNIELLGNSSKASKYFAKGLQIILNNQEIYSLYKLKIVVHQIMKCDPNKLAKLIENIQNYLNSRDDSSYEDRLVHSTIYYFFAEASKQDETIYLEKSLDILNELDEKLIINKLSLIKDIILKIKIQRYSIFLNKKLNKNIVVKQKLTYLYFLFDFITDKKLQDKELCERIGQEYIDLFEYNYPDFGLNSDIFHYSKSLFKTYGEYRKRLSKLNSTKIDLCKLFYQEKSLDIIYHKLGKDLGIINHKVNTEIFINISTCAKFHFEKSENTFMKLFSLSVIALRTWNIIPFPFLEKKFSKDNNKKQILLNEYKVNLKNLTKVTFNMNELNINNLEEFIENTYCHILDCYLYSQNVNELEVFQNMLIEFFENLPRFIMFSNFQLLDKYYETLLKFYSNKNVQDFLKHKKEFSRTFAIYFYHQGKYEKTISILTPYLKELSRQYFYYQFISYKSNINLGRYDEAKNVLLNYDSIIGKLRFQETMKIGYTNLIHHVSEFNQILLDYYLKLDDSEEALEQLYLISKRLRHNQNLNRMVHYKQNFGRNTIVKDFFNYNDLKNICFCFNQTKINTVNLKDHFNSNNCEFIDCEVFDHEHLSEFGTIKLDQYAKIYFILFVYGKNGKIYFNSESSSALQSGEMTPDDIVIRYFNNVKLKVKSDLQKLFFFNIFDLEREVNLPFCKSKSLIDKISTGSKIVDPISFLFPLYIHDVFLQEQHFQTIEQVELSALIDVIQHNFMKPLKNDCDTSTERIKLSGWIDYDSMWDIIKLEDENISPSKNQKRLCVIISNSDLFAYYTNVNSDDMRMGDVYDKIGISFAFLYLNYKLEYFCDEPGENIKKYIKSLAKDKRLEGFESITVFILSHGNKNGKIFGNDGEPVSIIEDILIVLNDSDVLKGKQKIIIINACRGNRKDFCLKNLSSQDASNELIDYYYDEINDHDDEADDSDTKAYQQNNFTNMFLCYSTIEGFVSYREPSSGSWLIQAFLDSVIEYGSNISLIDIMISTNRRLLKNFPDKKKIKPNHNIPKQAAEIIMYNWPVNYKL